jgi:hypothetical protein
MDLSSHNLMVVSTDGSYFGLASAYLVDESLFGDELTESFHEGSDLERREIALEEGQSLAWILKQGEPRFISKNLMYEIKGCIYDNDNPVYRYFVPLFSGHCHMVDCWIVNEEGEIHPGYSSAGVPIGTERFSVVGDSPFLEN